MTLFKRFVSDCNEICKIVLDLFSFMSFCWGYASNTKISYSREFMAWISAELDPDFNPIQCRRILHRSGALDQGLVIALCNVTSEAMPSLD